MTQTLEQVLVEALKPYKAKMMTWNPSDIELLFMGFGNISIYWKNDDPVLDSPITGTFSENAKAVVSALNQLNLNTGNWTYKDIYWIIDSNSGEPRADLISAIESCGFNCYDFFDADTGQPPEAIKTFSAEPSLV